MTITEDQLYWAAVNAPNVTDGMNRLQVLADAIRAEATAAAYGAAADMIEDDCSFMSPHQIMRAVQALTDADATAWLAARDAAQFKAGQEAALKGAVKGWAVLSLSLPTRFYANARIAEASCASGETIRPCLILVGEGE
jgi:predicted rRNA methylase YqxC with S4 and FtsJ domains